MSKYQTLAERIEEIQSHTAESRRILAFRQALDKSNYKSKPPYFLVSQKTQKEMANALRIDTMKNARFLESLYARTPHHFIQIVTDRANLASQIEECSSIEDARKLLIAVYE